MVDVINQLAVHCRGKSPGRCAVCGTRESCNDRLMALLDELFDLAYDRWVVRLASDCGRALADTKPERQAAGRWIDELSKVVIEAPRTEPIKTIDAAIRVSRPFVSMEHA